MATNFYIKGHDQEGVDKDSPDWHVGKRVGLKHGKLGFIWAMHPEQELSCRVSEEGFINPGDKCIISEMGLEYTLQEFLERIVGNVAEISRESIGEKFS